MKTFSQFCEDASPLEQAQQLRDAETEIRAAFTNNIETKKRNDRFKKYRDALHSAGVPVDERDFAPQQ